MELTESGRDPGTPGLVVEEDDVPTVARAVLEAVGLWFLLSHNVDVDEADDEVADMTGSLSLLAEFGRVLELPLIAIVPPAGLGVITQPLLINSLLTLFGRVPLEMLRCNGGSCWCCSVKLKAGSPARRARLSAFGELAEDIGVLLCSNSSASSDEVIGLKPICGLESSSVDLRAISTGGDTLSVAMDKLPAVVVARGEACPTAVPAPIEVVESLRELAGFMSA